MAKRADTFAEWVAELKADDKKLVETLKRDEKIVRESATKMQRSLESMTVATNQTQESSVSAAEIFSALGVQASILGGTVGAVGGKIASLGSALSSLKGALLGLPGLIMGITAVLGAGIAAWISYRERIKEAKQQIKDIGQEHKNLGLEIRQQAATLEEKLILLRAVTPAQQIGAAGEVALRQINRQVDAQKRVIDEARKAQEEAAREIIRIGQGTRSIIVGVDVETGMFITRRARTQEEQLRVEAARKRIALEQERERAAIDQIKKLGELARLRKEKGIRDLDALEKQLLEQRLAKERADRERMAAEEEKRRLESLKRITERVDALRATPLGQVIGALGGAIGERLERARLEAVLRGSLFQLLPESIMRDIRGRLGLTTIQETAGMRRPFGRAGAIELSAFATTGRGLTGIRQSQEDRREEQKTKAITAIEKLVSILVQQMRGALGANP